jgi:hypothetical protein
MTSLIRPLHLFASQAACPSGWAALLFLAWTILQGARMPWAGFNQRLTSVWPRGGRRSAAGWDWGRSGRGWGGRGMKIGMGAKHRGRARQCLRAEKRLINNLLQGFIHGNVLKYFMPFLGMAHIGKIEAIIANIFHPCKLRFKR